ncbi:hypothetical protein C8F01DRAFT_1107706 [Mycena amicta]|nr:hypothetical protein C8F01DRAFT_1107706 [Mycena amicta]
MFRAAPRPSILSLFDPLASCTTEEPECDLFLRPRNLTPVRLTRRLVDVGDATLQFNDEDPLDDPTLEVERTPKMHTRQQSAGDTPKAISSNATLLAPTLVICPSEDDETVHQGFQFMVEETVATPSLFLATPSDGLIVDTIMAFPTPSPAPSLVASKPTDLHASFALHDDMETFNLLSDNISFLGHGDSDEESFELGGPAGDTGEPGTEQEPTLRAPSAAHPSVSSAITLQAPPFATPIVRQISPIPALSANLPAPPPLIPALKIVKRKRPEVHAEPKPTGSSNRSLSRVVARAPVFTAPPKVPAAPSTRSASSASAPTGQFVTDGPGPRRVPNLNSEKLRVVDAQRPVSNVSGPRRVVGPASSSCKVVAPSAEEATNTVVKRPLRTVATNTTTSALPRPAAANASRLPMPKSKIAVPTGLPRRKAA